MTDTFVFKAKYSSNPDPSLAIISDKFLEKMGIDDGTFILVSNSYNETKRLFLRVKFDSDVRSNVMFLSAMTLRELGIFKHCFNSKLNVKICDYDLENPIDYIRILIEPKFVGTNLEINSFNCDEIINDYLLDFFTGFVCPLVYDKEYKVNSQNDKYNGLKINIRLNFLRSIDGKLCVCECGKITNSTKFAFILGKYDEDMEMYVYKIPDKIFRIENNKINTSDLSNTESITDINFLKMSLFLLIFTILYHCVYTIGNWLDKTFIEPIKEIY